MEVGAVELLMYETIVIISQHERDNNLRLLNLHHDNLFDDNLLE